ncbi:hypothetical protein Lalb_Chr15g0079061 [Lupinus albus]|uniref:Uncharacterized protein n=1 Tax=Lupinus albus TaxID=3870 RepID=A0A6A4P0J0_LUPAL|nr:hypothetical protein Lalb_Chr15g0079061 [Lupinus albus]
MQMLKGGPLSSPKYHCCSNISNMYMGSEVGDLIWQKGSNSSKPSEPPGFDMCLRP